MEHDKSSRVCMCDGATKLQIRSDTSLLCASTQTTIIPVLGMAVMAVIVSLSAKNFVRFLQ